MNMVHTPLVLAMGIAFATLITSCGSSNSNSEQNTSTSNRLKSVTASVMNGGGELLIDSGSKLTWINDTLLDSRGDGCVSPGQVGPTEPSEANGRCSTQQFGGFNDWRAPTSQELTALFEIAAKEDATLKYLNPVCPALVGTDGIVRTENANSAVASAFPNAKAGDVIATSLASMNGVPAGVRCVRDGTQEQPALARFVSETASAINGGGELLMDTKTKLTWINDTTLDTRNDGCVSPAAVGPTEPSEANGRCSSQRYGGFADWRAPTTSELTEFMTSAQSEGATMKYLNPVCPALVGTDGIVRTENANTAAASAFPNAKTGDILATSIATMQGVPAGVRCVRDGLEKAPNSVRFSARVANVANGGGETLIDNTAKLEWINDTALDSRNEGCVSPANAGPIEPTQANAQCVNQQFAGHNDWRAPTSAELSTLITAAQMDGAQLKYLNAACPALVGTDGIVRTENANSAASSAFPTAQAGSILATSLANMNGVPAGVRCVRDL